MDRRVDIATIVAGVAISGFGIILLLDASGTLSLHFSGFAPLAALMLGAPLLASGLTRRG